MFGLKFREYTLFEFVAMCAGCGSLIEAIFQNNVMMAVLASGLILSIDISQCMSLLDKISEARK